MRYFYVLALTVIIALSAVVIVPWRRQRVLEARHAEVHISSFQRDDGQLVTVSGWEMHSGLCVDSVRTIRSGNRMIARVFLRPAPGAPCESTFRGSFHVPLDVNEIWFGTPPDTVFVGNRLIGRVHVPRFVHDWLSGRGGQVIWRRQHPQT
jgi:hypothetical protein